LNVEPQNIEFRMSKENTYFDIRKSLFDIQNSSTINAKDYCYNASILLRKNTMYRRHFLKRSLATLSGAVLSSTTGLFLPGALAYAAPDGFTLSVVTDQPERSIDLAGRFLEQARLGHRSITFETSSLPGRHVGDVVFLLGHTLIDFRQSGGALAAALTQLADAQGFPRSLEHPVLLTFHAGNTARQATQVNVFQGNVLIDQLPLDADRPTYVVEGNKGCVTLAVQNRAVRIVEATCKHKTCVTMGSISKPGASLVCIPNRIRVTLDGNHRPDVDGITQ